MNHKIKKIVVVGGGSAGWMAASTFIERLRGREVILIESPNVPTVGVGESTLGFINDWMTLLGIKDEDFMKSCDATYKMSISFTDFFKKGSGTFHYPFGGVDIEGNSYGMNDWYLKKYRYPDTPLYDFADCVYPIMSLVNQNRISTDNCLPGYTFQDSVAYHFDATKFGNWLKTNYAIPRGVKHIVADVTDIKTNENGIEELILSTGEKVTADLYVDCTGFKSLLLSGAMKEKFISYEPMLPNNSAWATKIPYKNKREELIPVTNGHALGNGWVWRIPLWSRLGCGYVYSDKYIDDDDALEEFKEHLESKGQYYDDLEFKKIKFRGGIYDKIWVKNVAAIGLSAGFIEPLESNGLYSVHVFLIKLLECLDRDTEWTVTQFDRDAYNWICRNTFNSFAQFIAIHYSLSNRDDTEYWRDITSRNYLEISNQIVDRGLYNDTILDLFRGKFIENKYNENGGIYAISTGLNFFPVNIHNIISRTSKSYDLTSDFERLTQKLEAKKDYWNHIASRQPKVYDFLQERIYNAKEEG